MTSCNMTYPNPSRDQPSSTGPTEGESELISGFNTDYAAGPFALFFLVENAVIINSFTTVLFLGAFHKPYIPDCIQLTLLSNPFS